MVVKIKKEILYLSDVIKELPHNCILNKGITGCGGTTVELVSKRNSIILVPTTNLVINKSNDSTIFGLYGKVSIKELETYINNIEIKKIIATYDALPRLINALGDKIYSDYFLLVDEYHILFNSYSFRREAIRYILKTYDKFDKFVFMTATPLTGRKLLKELDHLPLITYEWEGANKVNISIRDKAFIQRELIYEINKAVDYNLHIFVNSINFIKRVLKETNLKDYRVVCSESSSSKVTNYDSINSPVRKINFYTSTAFEGCDIYDENGYSIIVSDSNTATTILDISTLVIQICGRLRNSKYKDEVLLLVNTSKHRYCKYPNKDSFFKFVNENELKGKEREKVFDKGSPLYRESEFMTYREDSYNSIYLIKEDEKIKFDDNLKNMDIENYDIINSIYNSTINVLKEVKNQKPLNIIPDKVTDKLDPITLEIKELLGTYHIYDDVKKLVEPIFNRNNIKINQTTIGKYLSTITDKKRKVINGKKTTVYIKK